MTRQCPICGMHVQLDKRRFLQHGTIGFMCPGTDLTPRSAKKLAETKPAPPNKTIED